MMKLSQSVMLTGLVAAALLVGCAGKVKKAHISATADPTQEIQRLDQEVKAGFTDQLDVLAPKDFTRSQKALKNAKEEMSDGESQEDILEYVAISQGHLEAAKKTASDRRPSIEGVISARDLALKAGAKRNPQNSEALKELDDELRDNVEDAGKMSAEKISSLQSRYMDLELAAIKATQLGEAKAKIEGVRSDAEKYAPNTLKKAEVGLKNAENQITSERRNPSAYQGAVREANVTANLLVSALDQNKKAGWNLDEATSLKLVNQQSQISGLKTQLDQSDSTAEAMGGTIDEQQAKLSAAGASIAMQKAIESARKEFTKEEADVFQQGDKLLIRLKTIKFASGSSSLPAQALPILAKVKGVAEGLNPEQLVVEGHTDSLGSAALNKTLSQKRAEAVASYFGTSGIEEEIVQAVGLGFDKPIASNKTANGRSINRRVDVIITPAATNQ